MASELNEKETDNALRMRENENSAINSRKERGGIRPDDGSPFCADNKERFIVQDAEYRNVFKDGVKLHPQPTADPLDPLNWSSFRKNTILATVMYL